MRPGSLPVSVYKEHVILGIGKTDSTSVVYPTCTGKLHWSFDLLFSE